METTNEVKTKVSSDYSLGTGRRKTAVARVRMRKGKGEISVNKRPYKEYFSALKDQIIVNAATQLTNTIGKYDVFVTVNGGGITGQAGAVRLGIARSLCKLEPNFTDRLREAGFLTRDSRMRERKKYGQKGARARFQFSKR